MGGARAIWTGPILGPVVWALGLAGFLSLVGCPTPVPSPPPGPSAEVLAARAPTADPGVFVDHLLSLSRAGDEQGWGLQLTQARRDRGPAYLARHFAAWRRDILKAAAATTGVSHQRLGGRVRLEWRTQGATPGSQRDRGVILLDGERLVRVRLEGGALKIDEN